MGSDILTKESIMFYNTFVLSIKKFFSGFFPEKEEKQSDFPTKPFIIADGTKPLPSHSERTATSAKVTAPQRNRTLPWQPDTPG